MFGALFIIAESTRTPRIPSRPSAPLTLPFFHIPPAETSHKSKPNGFPWDPGEHISSESEDFVDVENVVFVQDQQTPPEKGVLTALLPHPGYFVAGGVAGAVSRTATAPLDRLKVYLIAQVDVKDDAIKAAKSDAPVKAAHTAARPLIEATKTLWRMGGMQSFFAG